MATLQKRIIAELKVQPVIDPARGNQEIGRLLESICPEERFFKRLCPWDFRWTGLDTCREIGTTCCRRTEPGKGGGTLQFIAVRLPYGTQFDEDDCQDALDFIGPSLIYTVNIKEAVDASERNLTAAGVTLTDYAKGNEKARERMKVQYSIAAMHDCVVLGSDHAAEAITGFYTKFGDGGADLMPIFRLNKRQGKQLLKELGCPEHLYTKVPTADLEEDKPALPDEVALGVTYDAIDDYLEGKEVPEAPRKAIENHFLRSAHKRHMPITIFDDFWK